MQAVVGVCTSSITISVLHIEPVHANTQFLRRAYQLDADKSIPFLQNLPKYIFAVPIEHMADPDSNMSIPNLIMQKTEACML
jgi:hypothetical protein